MQRHISSCRKMTPPNQGEYLKSGPEWAREKMELQSIISHLIKEISEIQKRLGTTAELPGDVARAAHFVHQVNNLRTTLKLNSGLRGDDGPPLEPPMFEAE